MDFSLFGEQVGILLLGAAFGLLVVGFLSSEKSHVQSNVPMLRSEGPVFLFDGEQMVDCNASARAVLSRSAIQGGDWQKLLGFLIKHFDKIEEKLADLPRLGALAETAEAGNGKILLLQADLCAGITKITLLDPDLAEGPGVALAVSHRAMETEVEDLRSAVSAVPVLIWRESTGGEVTWANNAYVFLAASALPLNRALSWPLPRLFERSATLQSAQGQRQSVALGPANTAWFDLVTHAESSGLLCFALPVDAAVRAENSLREFMQTLSKTFAQLPIGLAIFDKDRRLQMFNPALVELTSLPPDFLTLKPSMVSVLDAMRERGLLPEPKDYHNWRRQIIEMERAAASGLFQENWSLPDGQTFRVTGRPHPNGGLALMIEDISTEMQRSRRYRSDLEISQSVIDHVDSAIVVFSQYGQLMWSNSAYTRLWDHDPATTLDNVTVRSVSLHWKSRTAPTPLWTELDEFIHTIGNREPWTKEVRLLDGRLLHCAVTPVASGATMITFKSEIPLRANKPSKVRTVPRQATAAR